MLHYVIHCYTMSPSPSHSTHNYSINISTSTALCINYNDFVRNKSCQFWLNWANNTKNSFVSDGILLTKRNCLGYLTQLWDPLGLVTPATIEFRIDLQELWSVGYSCDEESQTKWMKNVQVLNKLLKLEFTQTRSFEMEAWKHPPKKSLS